MPLLKRRRNVPPNPSKPPDPTAPTLNPKVIRHIRIPCSLRVGNPALGGAPHKLDTALVLHIPPRANCQISAFDHPQAVLHIPRPKDKIVIEHKEVSQIRSSNQERCYESPVEASLDDLGVHMDTRHVVPPPHGPILGVRVFRNVKCVDIHVCSGLVNNDLSPEALEGRLCRQHRQLLGHRLALVHRQHNHQVRPVPPPGPRNLRLEPPSGLGSKVLR
mmetsp:Transcript_20668/g.40148  ORF Transcript_20668/g.40148 Transcript_20668/m.40148 type:complete len:218 (-) Transcript_20668:167-820(-)